MRQPSFPIEKRREACYPMLIGLREKSIMIRTFRTGALALLLASPPCRRDPDRRRFAQAERAGAQRPRPQPRPGRTARAGPAAGPLARRRGRGAAALYRGVGQEGLDPASYAPDRLREALAGGDPAALNPVASQTFLRLVTDLSGGQVRGDGRVDWHLPDSSLDGNRQQLLWPRLRRAASRKCSTRCCRPIPNMSASRRRSPATPAEDEARRELIRANMERWRWMPRDLGERHVIVNVPAFTAALVENGRVLARHRTVVGARRTPTCNCRRA